MAQSNKKITGPMCVVVALGFLGYGVYKSQVSAKLKSEGVAVEGRVLSHQTQSGRRGSKTYLLEVQYSPSNKGGTMQSEFKVPLSKFDSTPDGTMVTIRHLPNDPATAQIDGTSDDGGGEMFGGALVGVIGLVICFFAFRE